MVELRFTVSDVDYDSVIQALAGHMAGPALMALRSIPDSAKEEMVVRFINANAAALAGQMQSALLSKGVRAAISGAQATLCH